MSLTSTDQKGKGALGDVTDAAEEAYQATKTTIKSAYVDGTERCKKALGLHQLAAITEGGSSEAAATPKAPNVRGIVLPVAVADTPKETNHHAALPASPPNATIAGDADETTPLVDATTSGVVSPNSDADIPKRQSGIMVGKTSGEDLTAHHGRDQFLRLSTLIVVGIVGVIASIPSADMIRSDRVVPLHLAIFWTMLGFLVGHVLWPVMHMTRSCDEATYIVGNEAIAATGGEEEKGTAFPSPPQKSPLKKSISRVSFQEERHGAVSRPHTYIERKRDYVFRLFRGVSSNLVTPGTTSDATSAEWSSLTDIPGDIWTTLEDATRRTKAYWEEHVYDKPTGALMQRLLKYDDFRTKPCTYTESYRQSDTDMYASIGGDATEGVYDTRMKTERLGHVNTGNHRASTLQANIEVDPLFKLRGMDVFRGDIPEERVWRQPILEQNGLRDVPTFIVNLMLPGANLVVYFQMPGWIKRFEDIVEEADDAEDTKAFKRFLRGTDQYRNKRWKILPCLVDGPYIIKAMAPAQKEVTIAGRRVDASWHEYNESIDAETGKKRAALLEVDCDLISNPGVRKICNVVLGQVKNVRIDCAMIVEKPYLSEEEEPAACLGLWRMDKINVNQAALVPEKDEEQLLREMSVILNADDLVGLKDDLQEEKTAA